MKNLRNAHQSLQKVQHTQWVDVCSWSLFFLLQRHETLQKEKNDCSAREEELRKQLTKLRSQQQSSKEEW